MASATDELSALDALSKLYRQLPFEYLLVGHCLIVASWFPGLKNRFMLSYWVGLCAAFGGGIVSALLLQDPKQAPIALFSHNIIGVTWTICWWLVNYFPFGIVHGLVTFLPFRIIAKSCLNVLRAGLIAERVNLAVRMFPGVWAAPIVLGTVGGSGGKLVIDALLHSVGEITGPAELVSPGFPIRSGAGAAIAHWSLVHIFKLLTPEEGYALITTVFLVHGILSDLFGAPLDFTHLPARVVHALVNVPMPGHPGTPSKEAAPSKGPKAPLVTRPERPAPAKPTASSATSGGSQASQKKTESKKAK